MEAIEFLEFAKLADLSLESHVRSSVSRSYYCAYHEAKKFVEDYLNVDVDQIKGGSHERLSRVLIEDKNPKIRGLGYKMVTFHGRRVMADYKLSNSFSTNIATEAIMECEKILDIIKKLSS